MPVVSHPTPPVHSAGAHSLLCGCARLDRRVFTGLLLGAAAAPAAAAAPVIAECKRSVMTKMMPAASVEDSARQQYAQMLGQARSQGALAPDNHPQVQRLRYIADRIVPLTPACNDRAKTWRWEINLFGSKQVNAFCMPGGKIAFFHGILSNLKLNDDEVAVVMGHEVAHALLEHARERVAKSTGTTFGLRALAAVLGLGAVGDLMAQGASGLANLSFGRSDESEADALGLVLAAQAGYDPRAGVSLWQKMGAAKGGNAPPQWLSTHPAGSTRIKEIQARLPRVLPQFEGTAKPPRRFEVAQA